MNIKMINDNFIQGHPCRGCPYVFTRGGTDCIMGAVPGDCVWYFYRRRMGHSTTVLSAEKIRKQYMEYTKRKSETEKKLERGINMLLEVAELKYGRQYAENLKQKMS